VHGAQYIPHSPLSVRGTSSLHSPVLLTIFEQVKLPESHPYHSDILYGTCHSNIAGYAKLLPLTHKLFIFINIQSLETKYKAPLIPQFHCRKKECYSNKDIILQQIILYHGLECNKKCLH
jgi:hypothetical protein